MDQLSIYHKYSDSMVWQRVLAQQSHGESLASAAKDAEQEEAGSAVVGGLSENYYTPGPY